MKTLQSITKLRFLKNIVCVLAIVTPFAPAMGQCIWLHNMSSDTLFAGEVNQVVVVDSGLFSQENMGAILTPSYPFDFDPCSHCLKDTIKAESAVTNGFETQSRFIFHWESIPMGIPLY